MFWYAEEAHDCRNLGGMWFDHVKQMVVHTFSGSRCVYPLDDRRNNNVMWWLNYRDYSFLKSYSLLCSLPLDPFGIKHVDSTLLSCIAICWYYGIHPNWIDHWINSHVYYVHMSNFRYLSLSLYIIYRRNIFVIIYLYIYILYIYMYIYMFLLPGLLGRSIPEFMAKKKWVSTKLPITSWYSIFWWLNAHERSQLGISLLRPQALRSAFAHGPHVPRPDEMGWSHTGWAPPL